MFISFPAMFFDEQGESISCRKDGIYCLEMVADEHDMVIYFPEAGRDFREEASDEHEAFVCEGADFADAGADTSDESEAEPEGD